jgi:hypothetical protein
MAGHITFTDVFEHQISVCQCLYVEYLMFSTEKLKIIVCVSYESS